METKPVYKSKIVGLSIVLFIVGLEPFIPQIRAVLPQYAEVIGLVLPVLILAARIYSTDTVIK